MVSRFSVRDEPDMQYESELVLHIDVADNNDADMRNLLRRDIVKDFT